MLPEFAGRGVGPDVKCTPCGPSAQLNVTVPPTRNVTDVGLNAIPGPTLIVSTSGAVTIMAANVTGDPCSAGEAVAMTVSPPSAGPSWCCVEASPPASVLLELGFTLPPPTGVVHWIVTPERPFPYLSFVLTE